MTPTYIPQPSRGGSIGAAVLALISAGLLALGLLTPLVGMDGVEVKPLADAGSDLVVLFGGAAAIAAIAALAGLGGSRLAAAIGAGTALGACGPALFIVILTASDVTGSSGHTASVGFFAFCGAAVTALAGTVLAVSSGRTEETSVNAGAALLVVLAGAVSLGVPLALLLPRDGFGVLDLGDGATKAAYVVWAMLAPGVAFVVGLTRTRVAVATVVGISLGHVALSVSALVERDRDLGVNFAQGNLFNETLYHVVAVVAALLAMVGLALASTSTPTAGATQPGYVVQPYGYSEQPAVAGWSAGDVAAVPAGQWAADPFGRHELRWWDGLQWTESVSDRGVVSADPASWPVVDPMPDVWAVHAGTAAPSSPDIDSAPTVANQWGVPALETPAPPTMPNQVAAWSVDGAPPTVPNAALGTLQAPAGDPPNLPASHVVPAAPSMPDLRVPPQPRSPGDSDATVRRDGELR